MPILIGAQDLSKTFADRFLFQHLSFSLEAGERVGLIGPNGAGKSTLLRILSGQMSPDDGQLSLQRGLRVGFLEQVPHFPAGITVHAAVLASSPDPHDWEEIARAQTLLGKLELNDREEDLVENLSGGWRKRVALVRELMKQPDLLLLDEPTNHLDVESILWLEGFLESSKFATLTITHDRVFLQRVSNRILELNRRYANGLLSVQGDYVRYLETKEELLAAQGVQETRLRNTLRRETEWLRRGAKARTTKQQARINRHGDLSDAVGELKYRNAESAVRLDFQGLERNPKRMLETEGVTLAYGGKLVVPKLDLLITPKTRLGLLGANGSGKSSLIRLLLGETPPTSGTVKRADGLKPLYFEQNRDSLDPDLSVLRTICDRGDHVDYAGNRIHVRSYLDRFLFSGNQVEMKVGRLSGGEQARLLLARLMLQESNLLVLDEPTNDLDISTLDLLQEMLQEFKGAVIVASHDRYFLDQVSNLILGFGTTPSGQPVIEKFASLAQWEAWHDDQMEIGNAPKTKPQETAAAAAKKRLGFKEQRELDGMEATIGKAEAKLAALTTESASPALVANASRLLEITTEMGKAEAEIARLYARWQELSGKA